MQTKLFHSHTTAALRSASQTGNLLLYMPGLISAHLNSMLAMLRPVFALCWRGSPLDALTTG